MGSEARLVCLAEPVLKPKLACKMSTDEASKPLCIMVIGSPAVNKSEFCWRLLSKVDHTPNIQKSSVWEFKYDINGMPRQVLLFSDIGEEDYLACCKNYLHVNGFIFLYDENDKKTSNIFPHIRRRILRAKGIENMPFFENKLPEESKCNACTIS